MAQIFCAVCLCVDPIYSLSKCVSFLCVSVFWVGKGVVLLVVMVIVMVNNHTPPSHQLVPSQVWDHLTDADNVLWPPARCYLSV